MTGAARIDLSTHRPLGRLLTMCIILALVAAWPMPPAATDTQQDPQEGEEPSLTPDAPDAVRWAAGFGPMGMNDPVYALAVGSDGSPYAAGAFIVAGNTRANRIARWDGRAWYPLGNGLEHCTVWCVLALAVGRDGSLYAGGTFDLASGRPSSAIAQWAGESGRRTTLPLVSHSH